MIRILKYEETGNNEIFARKMPTTDVRDTVADMLKNVREHGDAALFEYAEKFDHAKMDSLLVTEQ